MTVPTRRQLRFLTIKQTAAQLAMSEKTIRRWIGCGALPSHEFGKAVRISEDDLTSFTAAKRR